MSNTVPSEPSLSYLLNSAPKQGGSVTTPPQNWPSDITYLSSPCFSDALNVEEWCRLMVVGTTTVSSLTNTTTSDGGADESDRLGYRSNLHPRGQSRSRNRKKTAAVVEVHATRSKRKQGKKEHEMENENHCEAESLFQKLDVDHRSQKKRGQGREVGADKRRERTSRTDPSETKMRGKRDPKLETFDVDSHGEKGRDRLSSRRHDSSARAMAEISDKTRNGDESKDKDTDTVVRGRIHHVGKDSEGERGGKGKGAVTRLQTRPRPHRPKQNKNRNEVINTNKTNTTNSSLGKDTNREKSSDDDSKDKDKNETTIFKVPLTTSPTHISIQPITDINHPAYGQFGLFARQDIPPDTLIVPYFGYVYASPSSSSSPSPPSKCESEACDGATRGDNRQRHETEHEKSDYDLSLIRYEMGTEASLPEETKTNHNSNKTQGSKPCLYGGISIDAARTGNEARMVNDYRGVPMYSPPPLPPTYRPRSDPATPSPGVASTDTTTITTTTTAPTNTDNDKDREITTRTKPKTKTKQKKQQAEAAAQAEAEVGSHEKEKKKPLMTGPNAEFREIWLEYDDIELFPDQKPVPSRFLISNFPFPYPPPPPPVPPPPSSFSFSSISISISNSNSNSNSSPFHNTSSNDGGGGSCNGTKTETNQTSMSGREEEEPDDGAVKKHKTKLYVRGIGVFSLRSTRSKGGRVRAGQEILVSYGKSFWKERERACTAE